MNLYKIPSRQNYLSQDSAYLVGEVDNKTWKENREFFWGASHVLFLDLSVFNLLEFIELYAYDICIFSMHYTLIKKFKNKIKLHARKKAPFEYCKIF